MLFTDARTPLGRLRAFDRELTVRYADAIIHRHFEEATRIYDRRRAARRAILTAEELGGDRAAVPSV